MLDDEENQRRIENARDAIQLAREHIKSSRIHIAHLVEHKEHQDTLIEELRSQLAKLHNHDHCCSECKYHSNPHRRCILR